MTGHSSPTTRRALAFALALSTACAFGLSTGCATNPATGKKQISLVGEEKEIQIGRSNDQQIVAQYGLYDDPELAAYVDQVGQRLAAESERPHLPWTFRVLDDPVVNAFALPGGFIYMTRGILSHMSSEAEMASVLGHEIGHVTARHGVNQMSKAQLANIGMGIGMIAAPEIAQSFGGLAQAGMQLLFLKYGRDDERQADDLGFRYAMTEGYNPEAFEEVFRMLGAASGSSSTERLPSYLSTHPDPGERQATARSRAMEAPVELRQADWNRDRHLSLLDGVAFGPDPRQGFFQGRTFVHPELAFKMTLPAGWKGFNTRSALIAMSPEQDAMVRLELAPQRSVDEAARAFYTQQGVRVVKEWRDGRGGLPLQGERFFTAGQAPQEIYGTAAFSEYDGRVYRLVGMTKQNAWRQWAGELEGSLESFDRLTDRKLLRAQPMRIDLVRTDRTMSLAEFNRRYPSDVSLERLSLLNHLVSDDSIPAGTLVKRVRGFDAGPQMNVDLR